MDIAWVCWHGRRDHKVSVSPISRGPLDVFQTRGVLKILQDQIIGERRNVSIVTRVYIHDNDGCRSGFPTTWGVSLD